MADTTMSRRERKKKETKANILKISRRLFEKNGYDNISVEDIAEMADISKPTFFNYFTSKDNLIISMAEEEAEDIFAYAQELRRTHTHGAVKKIKLLLERLIGDGVKYLHLTGQITFSSSICNRECPSALYTTYNQLWGDLIREGQANQEITDLYSAEKIAISIRGCYYGVLFKCFETGDTSNALTDLDCSLDMLFRGIGGEKYFE